MKTLLEKVVLYGAAILIGLVIVFLQGGFK
jgi:hypothetical protein